MSVALINHANRLRSLDAKIGGELAEAFKQSSKDHDYLNGKLEPLLKITANQSGFLEVDQLYVRNHRKRATHEDAPPIQNIAAVGNQIHVTGDWLRIKNTSGGNLTLTSAPTIASGHNGDLIEIVNVGSNNVVVQDQGSLANSNLRLAAASRTIAPRQSLLLRFSSDIGNWLERGFNAVL